MIAEGECSGEGTNLRFVVTSPPVKNARRAANPGTTTGKGKVRAHQRPDTPPPHPPRRPFGYAVRVPAGSPFTVLACVGRPREWRHALEGFNPNHAVSLKVSVGSEVSRATMLGRTVVVKVRMACGAVERMKRACRASRGWRQWRGVPLVTRAGARSPACLVLAVEHTEGGTREWLVMDAAQGRSLLEHLADIHAGRGVAGVRAQHDLARAMAWLLAKLDRAGLFNRDHKPSNIIVTSLGKGGSPPTFALIDTVAIRRGRKADRMLHALFVEPLGVGVPPRRSLAMRVIHELVRLERPGASATEQRARRHGLWVEVSKAIERHGDPRPRDNPLG